VCHGELARDRPPGERLTEFYFWLSVGGVLGGVFNALVAPLLFPGVWEYPIVLVLACLLRPAPLAPSPPTPLPRGGRGAYGFAPADWLLPAALGGLTAALVLGVQALGVGPGPLSIGLMFAAP